MGLLTDFIAGRAADAAEIAENGYPYGDRRYLETMGIDITEIALLYQKIHPHETLDPIDDFPCLVEHEEQWVHLIPDRVARAIAEISDGDIARIGSAWQEGEDRPPAYTAARWLELRRPLPDVLARLVPLARFAQAERLDLLLYTSL